MKVKSLSRARLCATPETAAHQAPPSLGFSSQEHWSGVPLSSPMGCHFLLQGMKVKRESEVAQSRPTLSDPMVTTTKLYLNVIMVKIVHIS